MTPKPEHTLAQKLSPTDFHELLQAKFLFMFKSFTEPIKNAAFDQAARVYSSK